MKKENNLYNYSTPKSGNEESSFFLTKGRITTVSLYLRIALSIGIYGLSYLIYHQFSNYFNDIVYGFVATLHMYLIPFFLVVFVLIQGAKRMHDINKSGWYFLIPLYNVYLSFEKGTLGSNNYGIDPKTIYNVTYFDELDDNLTEKNKQVLENKKNKDYSFVVFCALIFLIIITIIFQTKKQHNNTIDNFNTVDSTAIDTTSVAVDTVASTNTFDESEIVDIVKKPNNNEADAFSDSEINLEDEFEDIPNEDVLELVKDPRSKDVANVFWKRGFTLIDYSSNEPIFPELVNDQFIYKIYYSSNEDPTPHYGEFTKQELENHYYYKFINKASCLKFCNSKK